MLYSLGESARPNLLFVCADQLREQSCGFGGDSRAQTPNLDRLAAEGVRFSNATSMHPVCAPYRASLLTGCYSSTTGMVINELRARTDLPTLPQALNRGGYASAFIGKWHLWASEPKGANPSAFHANPANQFVPPGPNRMGFDDYWAGYNFNHRYYRAFYYRDGPERIDVDGYEPDVQTDLAIDYLRRAAARGKPFDLFLSYSAPHPGWNTDNVPAEWLARFADVEFPVPANYEDGSAEYWHRPYDRAWWLARIRPNLSEWQRVYCAMVANIDWNAGRLLAALDALGLADDTLVVVTSDHGEMFGSHGRIHKNIFYDEAARVPLLMRWPGRVAPGSICDVCLNTPDLMPTLLGLLGVPIPKTVEGMDLSNRALSRQGSEPVAALLQGMGPSVDWDDGFEWRAVRDAQYTYAVWRVDGKEELYDNCADPLQQQNLAGDPLHAGTRRRLKACLVKRMEELGDTFETVTWCRDHWTRDGVILRGARG